MLRLYILSLSLVLSACGGGGIEAAQTDANDTNDDAFIKAMQACASTGPVRIQMFGDSTQWEQFDAVQRWMDDRYGVGAVKVTNLGVSGTTAVDFPAAKVDASAITVVNYGINDSRQENASINAYKERLRRINPSAYETPSPPFDAYASAMNEVAAERNTPVLDVSARVRAQIGWSRQIHDGVHPNAFLYEWITFHVVVPALTKMVDERSCQTNVHRLSASKRSSIRIAQNSAGILWGLAGKPTEGLLTFENQGRSSATLTFSGLQAPYAVYPAQCTVPANGGTCTVKVSMAASSTLGGQGTQILVATGGSNGPIKAIIWGNVTEP